MSNKKKKLARALSKKTGMSHHAAMNVLSARMTKDSADSTPLVSGPIPRPSLRRPGETFVTWLLRQPKRDDFVGDLSADLGRDAERPTMTDYVDLLAYLTKRGVRREVRAAARAAFHEYSTGMKERLPQSAFLRAEESTWRFQRLLSSVADLLASAYGPKHELVTLGDRAFHHMQYAHNAIYIRTVQEGGVVEAATAHHRRPAMKLPFDFSAEAGPLKLPNHIALGRQLKGRRMELAKASRKLGLAYPPDDHVFECIGKAEKTLLELLSALDDQVGRDHPRTDTTVLNNAYFGDPEDGVLELQEPGSSYRRPPRRSRKRPPAWLAQASPRP